MATAKSAGKSSSGKRPGPEAVVGKPKAAPKKKAVAKVAASKAPAARVPRVRTGKAAAIPLEQRRYYVEVAAYHIAERRGFAPGDPLQDWVQAEAEIDRLLAEGRLGIQAQAA